MWRIANELEQLHSPHFVAITRKAAPAYRIDVEFYAIGTARTARERAGALVGILNRQELAGSLLDALEGEP